MPERHAPHLDLVQMGVLCCSTTLWYPMQMVMGRKTKGLIGPVGETLCLFLGIGVEVEAGTDAETEKVVGRRMEVRGNGGVVAWR